ncbi:hypothetical protein AKO1_012837 [Acrasis kona]|uniref:Enhancer of mRNA-decapping protein 4 C-terminal domain-containing protein n=1 Tax=Acrasis kona TaxID=1008807 RepID=A0AAW2YVA8_9EUKA
MDTNTLIVLHLDDQYKIDHVAEFESNHAIVSFKSMVKYDDQENNHMIGLFCLEKEAVTLVSITLTDVLSNIYAKLRTTTYTKLSTAVPQPHAQSTSSPIKSSPSPPLNAQQPPKDNSQQQSTRQVKSPIAATQPTSPIVTPSPRSLSTPSQFQSSPITQSKSQPPLPQEIIATTTSTPSSSTAATSIPSPSPKSNQTIPTNQLHQPIPHTPSPRASQSKTQTPIETENENSTNNELLRELKKMEKRLLNRMEETIEKQTQKQYDQLYKNLERERLLRVKEEREKQEELLDTIAKAICQDIPNEVIGAMQNQILPQIGDELEQRLDQQLNNALQKQFERLGPLVESSIVTSAKQPIHESFQQVLKGTVIPAFQLSCQKMFSQISQTFESGMEERVKKPLRDHYVALNQETLSLIDQHLKQFADAHSPVMIQQAASGGLGAHASNIGGAHDGVVVNKKEQITNLIRSSAFENAFMIALSSQDLDLVLFTCEATNADTCLVQLSQPVLLSLLQQLSYELSGEKLNLKLDWIEKVLLSLDPSHYSINTHSHDILSSVLASLQKLFAKADQSKKSKVKMLIYVVHSQLSAPPGHKE